MSEKTKSYQAYLLRLWRVREARDTWRVSLEDAQTRELRGFGSLEELFTFLCEEVKRQKDFEDSVQADESQR